MRITRPTRGQLRILAAGGGLLALAALAGWLLIEKPFGREAQLSRYADQVIATCKDAPYPPSCYDTEIPKLMDQGVSMEEAFHITSLVQSRVKDYYYCHTLGHFIAAKETAKDPSKWTSVIARCPAGECANGCLHGVLTTKFQTDQLSTAQVKAIVPALATACEPADGRNLTLIEQASCYHSLGHLTVYLTHANLPAADDLCDAILKVADEHGSKNIDGNKRCYEGSFMQVFQYLEPEDIALVKDLVPKTRAAADAFCKQFPGARGAACYEESWTLSTNQISTPSGLVGFCGTLSDPAYQQDCYNMLFNILALKFDLNVAKIAAFCEGLPANRMAQCFGHSASRFVDIDYDLKDRAIEMCALADKNGAGERCYDELLFYSYFNYHAGSPEVQSFCKSLPAPWNRKCLNGDGSTISPHHLDV